MPHLVFADRLEPSYFIKINYLRSNEVVVSATPICFVPVVAIAQAFDIIAVLSTPGFTGVVSHGTTGVSTGVHPEL